MVGRPRHPIIGRRFDTKVGHFTDFSSLAVLATQLIGLRRASKAGWEGPREQGDQRRAPKKGVNSHNDNDSADGRCTALFGRRGMYVLDGVCDFIRMWRTCSSGFVDSSKGRTVGSGGAAFRNHISVDCMNRCILGSFGYCISGPGAHDECRDIFRFEVPQMPAFVISFGNALALGAGPHDAALRKGEN